VLLQGYRLAFHKKEFIPEPMCASSPAPKSGVEIMIIPRVREDATELACRLEILEFAHSNSDQYK